MSVDESAKSPTSVCVVGLGYTGLPTAVVLADAGHDVIGVDVSPKVVERVNAGQLPFVEEGLSDALEAVVAAGKLRAQTHIASTYAYIIAVPTPINESSGADLSYIDAACDAIAPALEGGEVIVLESTSPPGTTERAANRILAARPDLSLDGSDGRPELHFAHAPERVLPGRVMEEMTQNDRIIGGLDPVASEKAKELYATFAEGEISVTDAKTAELAKLTENAFRDVNIAFANELSLIADQLGVDVWELIELANRHPRVKILQPGPGVGGHCIAIDPYFIAEVAPKVSPLIQTAREVNNSKPSWVEEKVASALAECKSSASPSVALLGLAFKPNIDDLRESPALGIAEALPANNPGTTFHVVEPNVDELPRSLRDLQNVEFAGFEEAVGKSDVVVLLVDHTEFKEADMDLLVGKKVIDTRGAWRKA